MQWVHRGCGWMSDETEYLGCIKWSLSAREMLDSFRESVRMLKAENARLQGECERMFQANVEKNRTIAELVADNAKLRGLAGELMKIADGELVALDDDEFNGIINSADDLGVVW